MSEYRQTSSHFSHSTDSRDGAGLALLALVGFLLGCLLINATVTRYWWQPDLGGYTRKLEALAAHATDINTIVIGSSHVQYGFRAAQFETELAGRGITNTTFKLAIPSLTTAWTLHTLKQVQQLNLPNLRFIVVEPRVYPVSDLATRTRWRNAASLRSRYISTWPNTQASMELVWASKIALRRKLIDSIQLTYQLVQHVANIGVLQQISLPATDDTQAVAAIWQERGGNITADGAIRGDMRLVAPDSNAGYRPLSGREQDYLQTIIATIQSMGAQPVFLFVPGRDDPGLRREIRAQLLELQPSMTILGDTSFTQATGTYSDSTLWWDTDHLNSAGAHAFTADIATQWANQLGAAPE